jgi:hypothetical protein
VRPEPLDLELGARTLDEGDRELGDAEPTLEVEVRGTIMGDEPPTLEPEVRGVTSVRPPMVLPLRDDAELLPLPAEWTDDGRNRFGDVARGAITVRGAALSLTERLSEALRR